MIGNDSNPKLMKLDPVKQVYGLLILVLERQLNLLGIEHAHKQKNNKQQGSLDE